MRLVLALEETVLMRNCGYTRIRNRDGDIEVLPADISAAMFQHGTSRDNDPQLHTHCVIFNAARTHRDGKYRALHQHPVYTWMKAAGAVYRNAIVLEPARAPRHPHGTVWEGWRVHADRRDTGRPDRTLVKAPCGDHRSGPGDGLYGSKATRRVRQRRTRSREPASRPTTTRRFVTVVGVEKQTDLSNARH